MKENVKINIFEKDNTSPAGRGIDSTDIAFIPGFSVLTDAPKNVPTLVTSTREFEALFGTEPRVLTSLDVPADKYENYGFHAGDFDRSYVYAKELLFQGMPIVYANIAPDNYLESLDVSHVSIHDYTEKKSCVEVSSTGNIITIKPKTKLDNETVILNVEYSLDITLGDDNKPVTKAFEYVLLPKGCSLVKCNIDAASFDKFSGTATRLSTTQYELCATSTQSIEKIVAIVELKVSGDSNSVIELESKQPRVSLLDGFYTTKLVDKMLEVDGDSQVSIADKSIYSVKYITSGGYPSVVTSNTKTAKDVFGITMIKAAAHRGDAVALIDYQMSTEDAVYAKNPTSSSVYSKLHEVFAGKADTEFGTAMYPWGLYNCGTTLSFEGATSPLIEMPASFGYLMCVAKAIKSSPNWLAMAGVSRGVVPGLTKLLVPNNVISNTAAENMQPKFGSENNSVSVNAITNIRPYGLTIWGNRTLKEVSKDGTVALNFLNIRNMLSDVKKLLYTTAKSCMFEQDSTSLWLKFKGGIEPLLRRLKAGNGIADYQIVRGTTKYNGDPLTKGEIAAVIKIQPMYAVEYFELAVEINDEDVTVL